MSKHITNHKMINEEIDLINIKRFYMLFYV